MQDVYYNRLIILFVWDPDLVTCVGHSFPRFRKFGGLCGPIDEWLVFDLLLLVTYGHFDEIILQILQNMDFFEVYGRFTE